MAEPLVEARGVFVAYAAQRNLIGRRLPPRPVLHGVDVKIGRGETVGIVGESGSGKTMLARAILQLLPRNATLSGSIDLDGVDLTRLRPEALRRLRGPMIAVVFLAVLWFVLPQALRSELASLRLKQIHRP
jgi:ABC-type glutathione transport system ATPase component